MLALQPSERSAVCSLRQARVLPLPFSMLAQNFVISVWQAAQCLPVPAGAGAASSAAKAAALRPRPRPRQSEAIEARMIMQFLMTELGRDASAARADGA